jgi:two-component system, LytTR family, sensor kinase
MFLSLDKDQKLYELIEKGIQKGVLYHIFFWVVFFFFLIIMDSSDTTLASKMIHRSIRIFFYVIIVYTNLNFLFPRYLKNNYLLIYVILLFLLVAVSTPIEVCLHYLFFAENDATFEEIFTVKSNSSYFLNLFFIAFSSSIYKIISDWMEHQRERTELQRQNLRSELKYLKTQINPHFFFNTLNSLYALTLKKSDRAPEIVLKLSDMMRYMLYESNERTIALSQEINYIENYLDLEKLRHGDNFKIELEVHGDPKGHEIAPLMFIPFLENSFKHGIDHELKSGYVKISLSVLQEGIELSVVNSKPQAIKHHAEGKKVGGIGLANVRRRLNILYPSKHDLTIIDGESEFKVTMKLKRTRSDSKKKTKSII